MVNAVFLLGVVAGCRVMTPLAVLCWYMWLTTLPVREFNAWQANVVSVLIFSTMAVGEYVADTLPQTPSRKSWPLLIPRMLMGAFVGMSIFSSFLEPLVGGALFGLAGSLFGVYVGYALRMRLARRVGSDFPVAIAESVSVLLLSLFAMHILMVDVARQAVPL